MTKLKKVLGFVDITLATVGYIIGAGIYAIIGLAAKYSKNFTWISVLLCGLLATCTGLSYSELSSSFNINGGEYFYAKEAINQTTANITAYIILITEILVLTTLSFALGNHLNKIIPLGVIMLAILSLLFFGFLNYSGIRNSVNYNNIATVIETIGLIMIAILGFKNVKKDIFDVTKLSKTDVIPIFLGMGFIYFAYFGFDIIIELTEETKNSEEVIPKAMMTGIGISTLLYFLVTVAGLSSIGWKKLSMSPTPMAEIANKLLGGYGFNILLTIALISMSNTILMGHIGTSRFVNSISRVVKLPFNMDKIDEKTRTPKNAIIVVTVMTLIGVLLGNLKNSTIVTTIGTLLIFFIVNLCVIILRYKYPDRKRPFKIPLNIKNIPITSVIGMLSSILVSYTLIKYN